MGCYNSGANRVSGISTHECRIYSASKVAKKKELSEFAEKCACSLKIQRSFEN